MKPYNGRLPVSELRRLRARGWSAMRIAAVLGCSGPSVIYALRELGIARLGRWRRWTAAEDARLSTLWHEGLTLRNIATRIGRDLNQVSGRRRRLGLPQRTRSHQAFSPEQRAAIIARWGESSLAALAADIGRRRQAISRYGVSKLGLLPRRGIGTVASE